jgi:hypothetical protein
LKAFSTGMTATVVWLVFLTIVEPGTANFSSEGFQGAREEKCSRPVATSPVKQCRTICRRAPDTASRTVRPQRLSSGANSMDVRCSVGRRRFSLNRWCETTERLPIAARCGTA